MRTISYDMVLKKPYIITPGIVADHHSEPLSIEDQKKAGIRMIVKNCSAFGKFYDSFEPEELDPDLFAFPGSRPKRAKHPVRTKKRLKQILKGEDSSCWLTMVRVEYTRLYLTYVNEELLRQYNDRKAAGEEFPDVPYAETVVMRIADFDVFLHFEVDNPDGSMSTTHAFFSRPDLTLVDEFDGNKKRRIRFQAPPFTMGQYPVEIEEEMM